MQVYLIYHPKVFTGYVGIAKNGIGNRWKEHVQSAKGGDSPLIHQANRKYGESSFERMILEECSNRDELQDRENYWIHELGTLDPLGWNMNAGTAKPALRQAKGQSTVIPESHPPFRKKGASLYLGVSGKSRSNEETLGEAHALAEFHGNSKSAATVHYAVAAILDGHDGMYEAGYKLMVYICRYHAHYQGYPKRRWHLDKAKGLAKPIHEIAQFAIKHTNDIVQLHDEYLINQGSPHGLIEGVRELKIAQFRNAIRELYFSER